MRLVKGGIPLYPNYSNLAQEVKREVIADLQQGNHTNTSQPGNPLNNPGDGNQGTGSYFPFTANQTYQTVKDSVKNEVLTEIQKQQLDNMARVYGLDRSLSDQRIQQMIDTRFRTIDNLKADLKKELLALQAKETAQTGDPYTRQIATTLAEEARRQGLSKEQLMQSLEQNISKSTGPMGRLLEMLNTGQRRGFLGGIGMMLLCHHVILPLLRGNMRSVAVRSMEEGIAMVDRAKSLVRGQQQQGGQQQGNLQPQNQPTNFSPVPEPPPPGGNQPPGGTI